MFHVTLRPNGSIDCLNSLYFFTCFIFVYSLFYSMKETGCLNRTRCGGMYNGLCYCVRTMVIHLIESIYVYLKGVFCINRTPCEIRAVL